jgi:hypothetical protein
MRLIIRAAVPSIVVLALAVAGAACGDSSSSSLTSALPTGPSPMSVERGTATTTSGEPTSSGRAPMGLREASLAGAFLSAPRPFPPRHETFAFRQELEQIYRTELGRSTTTNYFDVQGDSVWTQEYMRYRVYTCSHLEAVQRVFEQIDRGVVAPVCGQIPGSHVAFPPYADSLDFRQRLDVKYRDDLRRMPSPTFVDAEGAIVWTREYLRYRVFACDDETSRAAVRTLMHGGPSPPFCYTTEPAREVLGHWSGLIAMPEVRPFTMDITSQYGVNAYSGRYRDIAFGTVSLTWDGGDRVDFFVNFGDGAGAFQGTFVAGDRVRGSMKYDKIATRFDFDMTRQ